MYRITKEFHFSASHQLMGLRDGHPCAQLHGHNYIVEVELSSETLDPVGFVRDYRDLGELKTYIDDEIDHRHLNDVVGDNAVSTEQIAKHFYDWCVARWPEVSAVRVSETPKTWAEYRPSRTAA
ncbi:MAG: 6-pyruvoyl tetrahydropterin synthase family protein [Pseudomonadota bacterium]